MNAFDFVAPIFVPGNRPDRFDKAAASGADAIIIDLEDAVPPGEKVSARKALGVKFTDLPVLVRINGVGTEWHLDDLAVVQDIPIDAVIVPKAELLPLSKLVGAAPLSNLFVALIETARGLADARSIAALPSVKRLMFGSIDFSADVGCSHTREALLAARAELVLASRLAGKVAPIEGVTTKIDDAALVLDDSRYARELGFGGKLCIHPKQVPHVYSGFQPDVAELVWARKVLASGQGATTVDGMMVDEPVRIRARSILARSSDKGDHSEAIRGRLGVPTGLSGELP